MTQSMLSTVYPNLTYFVENIGRIEIGYDDERPLNSFVRAINAGGLVWEGKDQYDTLEDALQDVENGIEAWLRDTGIT